MEFRRIVTLALGLLFIVAGVPKVVPVQPLHDRLVSDWRRYSVAFPFNLIGIGAEMYRTCIGSMEIVMSALMVFGRPDAARFSTFCLMNIMISGVYVLTIIGDHPAEIAFNGLVAGLLGWLLYDERRHIKIN
ncbi:uncharacterized protein [Antedon mediterranea]|uniref:uncharacterized protein n=1 Tax=Antedon mediterranea TaxID=105859 RepID=UPI003AF6F399